jgi:hypothetical protein
MNKMTIGIIVCTAIGLLAGVRGERAHVARVEPAARVKVPGPFRKIMESGPIIFVPAPEPKKPAPAPQKKGTR